MSSEIAIEVANLSKRYQIYNQPHDRLKQSICTQLQRLSGRPVKQYFREFWALRDVSFSIGKGETVGIVGRNGSGKSTLLQLICGTLDPTSGTIRSNGRVAALLELGSGFNPEFSGRENVYLNAAVLGLSRDETMARFDDIAAFADVGDFIDQPVKTYSSGMLVRLAFAVAINVDPEILVVDEALSVGDELFQRRCFSRIEAMRSAGTTILFVSHSGSQVIELCERAILLDGGEKLAIGAPKKIVGQYQKLLYSPPDKRAVILGQIRQLQNDRDDDTPAPQRGIAPAAVELAETFDPSLKPTSTFAYESHGATIENPHILDLQGNLVNTLICDRTYRYAYTVRFEKAARNVRFGMLIKTVTGLEVGGAMSAQLLKDGIEAIEAGTLYRVEFSFGAYLNTGTYFLNAGVLGDVNGENLYLHRMIDVAMFRIMPDPSRFATGIVDFGCVPDIRQLGGTHDEN